MSGAECPCRPLVSAEERSVAGVAQQVTMYSTVWCGYCRRLKDQMEREGIDYSVVDIEDDPTPPSW